MATPNRKIAREAPWLFAWLVRKLTPQHNGVGGRDFLLNNLWSEYPSVGRALLHLPGQLVWTICLHSLKTFICRMASAELCVLIWFAFDMLTPQTILLLVLTFAGLLVWEAYVPPSERLAAEFVTAIIIPPLMLFLAAALGAISPALKVAGEILSPRLGAAAVVIAIFRYNTAREPGPAHRYKELLLHHHYTWYLNDLWIAGGLAYLLTLRFAAPGMWSLPILTNISMMLFTTGIRYQLNPISGTTRHCRIDCKLFTDPDQADVRMKAEYLLTGADWFRNFSMQGLLEILGFVLALIPLVIAAGEWYTGDSDAASLNWFRMALSAGGWLVLLLTWPLVKKLNRRTRKVFDQVIQTFSRGPKNNCKYFGTSGDISSERTDMTSGEDGKDKTYQRDFVEIFRNNRQMLYLAARKYLGKHEDAEEAVQNAFADLWYRRSQGEVIDNPIGFVHGTIVHKALKVFRKQIREKRMLLSNSECEQIPAPESVANVDDRIEYIRAAMEKMKPQLARILHLCCVEKKPCHVVAKMLRKPLGTIHVYLWRAKFQLTRLIRIEEKRDEAQKNKHRGISKPGLADSSAD